MAVVLLLLLLPTVPALPSTDRVTLLELPHAAPTGAPSPESTRAPPPVVATTRPAVRVNPSRPTGPLLARGPQPRASPVLGTYDASALLVPAGTQRDLDPQASLWAGDGGAYVFGENLTWNVTPASLGWVSSTGVFTAGATPGSGTVQVTATLNGTNATDATPIVVYDPECVILTFGEGPFEQVASGTTVTVTARYLDQAGNSCSPSAAPSPISFSLFPRSFGTVTPGAGNTSHLEVDATAGTGWLNASATGPRGTLLTSSLELAVAPSASTTLLQLTPQSASLPEGGFYQFTTSLENPSGVDPSGSYAWSLWPASLGTLLTSAGTADLTGGAGPGTGWLNVTFAESGGGTLSASAPVEVVPPSGTDVLAGAYAPYTASGPLLPGEGTSLEVDGTDPWGGLYDGSVTIAWTVTPVSLGSIVGSGTQVVFVAGAHPGNGTVLATLTDAFADSVQVAFPITIVPSALSSVSMYGGPSDAVTEGSSAYLEGVDQDLFGNLLLGGGYYGLLYADLAIQWSLAPSDLGTLVPIGNGTPQDLPESAIFTAGLSPGRGVVTENLSWDGQSLVVTFPIDVVAVRATAVVIESLPLSTPYGGVLAGGGEIAVQSLLLDQNGEPFNPMAGPGGNYSWTLSPGSDATIVGGRSTTTLLLAPGPSAGVVAGTVYWAGSTGSGLAPFFFDVVEPSVVAAQTIVTGGPEPIVDVSLSGAEVGGYASGPLLTTTPTTWAFGSTEVPGSFGSGDWSLFPTSFGTLSNVLGSETNLTIRAPAGSVAWLNLSWEGPQGFPLDSSLAIGTYLPVLSYLQELTGPCSDVCSPGLATFAGNEAYVAVQPMDQVGRPYTGQLAWSAGTTPSGLASTTWNSWPYGSGAVLVQVSANATAGNGSLLIQAAGASDAARFALPIAVLAAPVTLAPTVPQDLLALPSTGAVTLSWTPPASAGAGTLSALLVNYTIEVQDGSSPGIENISTHGTFPQLPQPSWVDTGLDGGTVYHFRVEAWNSLGLPGAWTAWVAATPLRSPTLNATGGASGGLDALQILVLLILPAALVGVVVMALVLEGERRERAARAAARRRARKGATPRAAAAATSLREEAAGAPKGEQEPGGIGPGIVEQGPDGR